MAIDDDEVGDVNLQYSFLDILSNGIGASVLLFLMVAVVRYSPPSASHRETYINAEWRTTTDTAALLNLVLEVSLRDGGRVEADLPVDSIGVSDVWRPQGLKANVRVFGFSRDGQSSRRDVAGSRVYKVLVDGADDGDWRVGVRYMNRSVDAGWTDSLAVSTGVSGFIEGVGTARLAKGARIQFGSQIFWLNTLRCKEACVPID